MKKHYDIIIKGRVQNVGFRFYAQKTAHSFDITGFVKNQRDGSVYIEAEGNEENIQQFINWCHKGTPWADVESVHANPAPLKGLRGFIVD